MVIANGGLLQAGSRREVFGAPSSPEVARLLGIANLLPGRVRPGGGIVCGDVAFEAPTDGLAPGAPLWWSIRPEQIRARSDGKLEAVVVDVIDLGATSEVVLQIGREVTLRGRGAVALGVLAGERCQIDLPPGAIAVWPRTP